jgi:hypothetical protein
MSDWTERLRMNGTRASMRGRRYTNRPSTTAKIAVSSTASALLVKTQTQVDQLCIPSLCVTHLPNGDDERDDGGLQSPRHDTQGSENDLRRRFKKKRRKKKNNGFYLHESGDESGELGDGQDGPIIRRHHDRERNADEGQDLSGGQLEYAHDGVDGFLIFTDGGRGTQGN